MAPVSVLMTVFNRPPAVLDRTLAALTEIANEDEILVVNDGSSIDYSEQRSRFPFVEWRLVEAREYPPSTFSLPSPEGGRYNNPAHAWNVAIAEAKHDRLVFLGSDCVIPKGGLAAAKSAGDSPWFSAVIDEDSGDEYIGIDRLKPFNWFLSVKAADVRAIGGMDEEFLKGLACEDDDFGCLLGLYCGEVVFDLGVVVRHQSHPQWNHVMPEQGFVAYRRSLEYLVTKWGGAPWNRVVWTHAGQPEPMTGGPLGVVATKDGRQVICKVSLKIGFPDPLDGRRKACTHS